MNEAITCTVLPPKAGYVEVIKNKRHVYKNIKTGEILGRETLEEVFDTETDLLEMAVDHELGITLLELGITEE